MKLKPGKFFRYALVVLLAVTILGTMLYFAPKPFAVRAAALEKHAQVRIYCRNTQQDGAINVGNGFLVRCDVATLSKTLFCCAGVDGISVSFSATAEDVCRLVEKLDVAVCSKQVLDGTTVLCGKSSKICGGVMLDGQLVNVQIAFDGTTVTVGSPLILDSF